MGQVLHGCARTTEAVRRAIQHSQESIRALARRHGVNPKTITPPPSDHPALASKSGVVRGLQSLQPLVQGRRLGPGVIPSEDRARRDAAGLGENGVGRLGPDEGIGLIIVLADVAIDGGLQVGDRAEGAALETAAAERGEEGLHGIEPGGRGGGEWKAQRG
jgi:hypothetical protein